MKNQKGFSLVELLVVVIIIAIIAAIAIPSLLASRRAANEASAISSLRTINSAQATYFATLGNNSAYAATLAALGPASSGPALIDGTLAASTATTNAKSGYFFTMNVATPAASFCAQGNPDTGQGTRSFAVTNPGVILSWATGTGASCTDGVVATGGTAIQ